jgi:hypothetical protein
VGGARKRLLQLLLANTEVTTCSLSSNTTEHKQSVAPLPPVTGTVTVAITVSYGHAQHGSLELLHPALDCLSGESQVGNLDATSTVDEDVGRFDVPCVFVCLWGEGGGGGRERAAGR